MPKPHQHLPFHETLAAALDDVRSGWAHDGHTPEDAEALERAFSGGVAYETTKSALVPLAVFRGKPAAGRRVQHATSVSLYRMPSGRYELVAYTN